MSVIIVYGIPNCDTVKKTLTWLKAKKIDFVFHDYKKEGIDKKKLTEWCKHAGWETVLNKKGTTWRKLSPSEQAEIRNITTAVNFMKENTSAIKRPIIEAKNDILVGFDDARYAEFFT